MIKIKIVRGRTPYIYDAQSILHVSNAIGSGTCHFEFDPDKKKLKIFDDYTKREFNMGYYCKEYRVHYIQDLQFLREENIKKILES